MEGLQDGIDTCYDLMLADVGTGKKTGGRAVGVRVDTKIFDGSEGSTRNEHIRGTVRLSCLETVREVRRGWFGHV